MRYELKPITQENWRAAIALEVASDQKHLIETPAECLLEAVYDRHLGWTPLGLYVDQTMVGFAMIGAEHLEERYMWLDRFLIDYHHQHKGYGRALFACLLDFLKNHYPHMDIIYLSAVEENEKIFPFYQSFGFVNFGERDPNGEIIMYLKFDRESAQK